MLNAARVGGSDVWFDLAARLRHACWLLGSATYLTPAKPARF